MTDLAKAHKLLSRIVSLSIRIKLSLLLLLPFSLITTVRLFATNSKRSVVCSSTHNKCSHIEDRIDYIIPCAKILCEPTVENLVVPSDTLMCTQSRDALCPTIDPIKPTASARMAQRAHFSFVSTCRTEIAPENAQSVYFHLPLAPLVLMTLSSKCGVSCGWTQPVSFFTTLLFWEVLQVLSALHARPLRKRGGLSAAKGAEERRLDSAWSPTSIFVHTVYKGNKAVNWCYGKIILSWSKFPLSY
jgi:hypothetical protein